MRTPAYSQEEYSQVSDAIVKILSDGMPRSIKWIHKSLMYEGMSVTKGIIVQSCKKDPRIECKEIHSKTREYGLVGE